MASKAKKYVPADELKDLLNGLEELPWEENVDPLVDSMSTIEVVQSQWKYYKKQNIAVCKNCSFERDLDANFGRAISCPNCGARME